MSYFKIEFAGQLTDKENQGIGGARIELFEPVTCEILARGLTGESGNYKIGVNQKREPKLFDTITRQAIVIRVADGSGKVLRQARKKKYTPGHLYQNDFVLKPSQLKQFLPIGSAFTRLSGPVIDKSTLGNIDTAIETLTTPHSYQYNRYFRASRSQFPGILAFGTLLSDAWGTIEGIPESQRAFRASLTQMIDGLGLVAIGIAQKLGYNLIAEAENFAPGVGPSNRSDFPKRWRNTSSHHPSLVSLERIVPVFLATLHLTDDPAELASFLGALTMNFYGLKGTSDLLTSAENVLQHGDSTGFRGMLDYISVNKGLGGDPLPDFPDGFGGGIELTPSGVDPATIEEYGRFTELFRGYLGIDEEIREIINQAMSHQRGSGPLYHIQIITPNPACPGDIVELLGINFGLNRGVVHFTSNGSGRGSSAVPISWSDTGIRVRVPEGAGSGMVTLTIIEGTGLLGQQRITYYRSGTGAMFYGGAPSITSLRVNGKPYRTCVEPEEEIIISWHAKSGAGTAITIRVTEGPITYFEATGLSLSGSLPFTIPSSTTERTLEVEMVALNTCGIDRENLQMFLTVIPELEIVGIEVTQGIQAFPLDQILSGTDSSQISVNTIPLVAGKDTIVRVYVASDRKGFNDDIAEDVSGVLRIDSNTLLPINNTDPATTGSPFISAGRKADLNRETQNHSIDFKIPAAIANGRKSLFIRVFGQEYCDKTPSAQESISWQWFQKRPLKVRFVRIRDLGFPPGTGTNTIPTVGQAQFTIQRAFDLLPSPATDIGPAWQATWNNAQPLNSTEDLSVILNNLDDIHNCSFFESLWPFSDCPDEDHAFWVGLTVPFNRGLARRPGNTSISAIYQISDNQSSILRIKTAHELAHNLSLRHVDRDCGGGISGEFFNHPNGGNLTEVPYDPFWNTPISGSVQDFMSYGCTRWISEVNWNRLFWALP